MAACELLVALYASKFDFELVGPATYSVLNYHEAERIISRSSTSIAYGRSPHTTITRVMPNDDVPPIISTARTLTEVTRVCRVRFFRSLVRSFVRSIRMKVLRRISKSRIPLCDPSCGFATTLPHLLKPPTQPESSQ